MSTKEKTLSYKFPTEKHQLIKQCIEDITRFGYKLTSQKEEGTDTKLEFELTEENN